MFFITTARALAPVALFVLALVSAGIAQVGAETLDGAGQKLGNGSVRAYAALGADGAPTAIGIRLDAAALEGLPAKKNRTSRCADLDGNGKINAVGECEGDYERRLALPAEAAGRADIPFGWVMANWNPEGHPPEPWLPPHFDIHFYQVSEKQVDDIRVGPCGIFVHCEDFQSALRPVPAKYVHPEHVNVEAVVGRMGNHLIDSKTPEFGKPPKPFTHTWIYGAYDGRIIFHEVMLTRAFLAEGPAETCNQIKQPAAWRVAGYYPTRYCVSRSAAEKAYTISLEGFRRRQAE